MAALLGCLIAIAVSVSVALVVARKRTGFSDEPPWNLLETGARQVTILAGLAGFAITAIVLLVTLSRSINDEQRTALNDVLVMFATAYVFYVGTAILFAYLPREDPIQGGAPRVSFALATNLYYRTLFLAWFALYPLMKTASLAVAAEALAWVLTASGTIGSLFTATIFCRLGLLQLRDILLLPLLALTGLALYIALRLTLGIGVASHASLYLTLAFFALNAVTFVHFSLNLLAGMSQSLRSFLARIQVRAFIGDLQATMVLLLFIWASLIELI